MLLHSCTTSTAVAANTASTTVAANTAALTHALLVQLLLLVLNSTALPQGTELAGRTPIFLASKLGHAECVSMLLEYNADPNIATKDGQTALLVASSMGHAHIVSGLQVHSELDRRSNIRLLTCACCFSTLGSYTTRVTRCGYCTKLGRARKKGGWGCRQTMS
jgi:hypothetical protein